MKIKKKKLRKRKNPYIDSIYQHLLVDSFIYGYPAFLSKVVAYHNMGGKCDVCGLSYTSCRCEGKRKHEFDTKGGVIQGPCEQCQQFYCICDYDIFDADGDINKNKVRKETWELAKRTLNDKRFKLFILFAFARINDDRNWLQISSLRKFYHIIGERKLEFNEIENIPIDELRGLKI